MKKNILSIIFLFLISSFLSLNAQNAKRQERISAEEKKIEAYIISNMNTVPKEKIISFKAGFLAHEEDGILFRELSKAERNEYITGFKERYLRQLYFQENPNASNVYKAVAAPICTNGGFENGNFGNTYSGFTGTYSSGECSTIPVNGNGNLGWNPTNIAFNSNNFAIVSPGPDPELAAVGVTLNRVNNGNWAARVNSNNPCTPQKGINRLRKRIVLQEAGIQQITFSYAIVAEFPNHPNRNPFFTARALDANGGELDRFCIVSNPANNPFFNQVASPNGCKNTPILWQNWTCGILTVTGQIGDVIDLEFIVADCGAGWHFGYAYIDDICTACAVGNNIPGTINLTPKDPCESLPLQICGTVSLPVLNGQTGTLNNITLDILQNGSAVTTLTNPTINGLNYCFTVNANDFPSQSGGYDFRANAVFNIGSGTQSASDTHTNPGQNNDYIFNNPNCCNINASPNFTMTTSCNNGNFCVTATASDLTAGNHGWSLHEMIVAGGGTSGSNTVIPTVQEQAGGTSVTFCGLDPSKSYYIKHGIWDTCYQWRERRIEVEKFKADAIFNFETADGTVKTEFCYGEDVYLDGTASYGENRYYIDVWRRPKGSTQNFAWYAGLGWTLNAQVGVINLTQALANLNPAKDLELAYEYKVKLAIANPDNCIPWTAVEHTFTFKCCDNGTINADFTGVIRTTGEVEVYDFDVFSNINAVHEWYVLSSPNHAAGPYTPVYSGTSTGAYTSANPLTLINNAQSGLYYTVIHKIKTDCGDICVSQELFFDKFQKAVAQDAVDACCLAFEYWPNGPGTPATFTADFDGDINSNGTLFVENFETYANANATHEWYVYSSPTPNGPYTLVTTVTSTTQTTVNLLNNAQSGIYYTIIHKVITDCLTECLDKAFWYNGNVLSEAPPSAKASEKLPDPCCIANPVIITANGVDITDTKTYTIPCGKSGVIIHATNLENVQYTSPDPVLFGGGSFGVPNGYPYSNFTVYITGIDSCGNAYRERVIIRISQCCLPAPTNVHLHGTSFLHWTPVPGAIGYVISPSRRWDRTCTCRYPVSIQPIRTTHNYANITIPEGSCTMVSVAAICANGEISPYSQDICIGGTGKGGIKGTDGAVVTGAKQLREVSITPNPTKGEMTFNIMANADIEVNVDIYDTYGTLIKSFVQKVTSDKASTISWDGSNLRKGIYFVNFRTKEETIYKQVIVK